MSSDDEPTCNRDRSAADAWSAGRHDRPRLSEHVIGPGADNDRWDERTPSWSRSPEYAYTSGVPVFELKPEAFRSQSGVVPDRVRVFGEHTDRGQYAALILIKDGTWTTTIRLEGFSLSKPTKAYLWALLEQQGHLERDSEPHEGVTRDG